MYDFFSNECLVFSVKQMMDCGISNAYFNSGELLAQPWTCPHGIEAGECAHKSSG